MNAIKQLVERALGANPSAPGQGTSWQLSHDFPWPAWGLTLFVLFAVWFVVWVYRRDAGHLARWRRHLLVALRLATIGVVLFLLSQALLSIERTGLPYVLVLLDVSNSMGTIDRYTQTGETELARRLSSDNALGQPSRLAQAQGLLLDQDSKFLRNLLNNHKLRLHTVAEGDAVLGPETVLDSEQLAELIPRIRELTPEGNETRLGSGLRSALNSLRGTPPSAVVLFSDGVSTDGESLLSAARHARQRSVPLYAVVLGSTEPVVDLDLHNVLVDDTAFVGEPAAFAFTLTGRGTAGRPAHVELRNADTGEVLASRDVTMTEDGKPQRAEVTFTPQAVGELSLILEAAELPQEASTANNRETRRISVRDEKLKVLLVDSLPRWEYRQLKDLLSREKTVELKSVLIDSDPGYVQEDRNALLDVPVTREELFEFDVVILGDVATTHLSASVLESLRAAVGERGRGLLLIAGPNHSPESFEGTPLEPVVPIDLAGVRKPGPGETLIDEFRPELTAEARKGSALFRFADSERESQEVWDFLPGFHWSVDVGQIKPGAIVYATHPRKVSTRGGTPLIVTQRYGNGKVLFHGIDELWRWRFRTGDTYYGRYWVQALRYLAHGRTAAAEGSAELVADRKAYQSGDSVTLRVRFLNDRLVPAEKDGVQLVVEGAGDSQQRLTLAPLPEAPSVFEGQLAHPGPGKYHAFIAAPTFPHAPPAADFEVRPSERETRSLRADWGEMNQAAILTGGRAYTLATAGQLAADIPPGIPVPLEPESPLKIWNHWSVLALFCGFLSLEWILRKRWRLV